MYDLKIANNEEHIVMTSHVSTKRHRGRQHRSDKLLLTCENKISQVISKNGIYQATLQVAQNDGGAN